MGLPSGRDCESPGIAADLFSYANIWVLILKGRKILQVFQVEAEGWGLQNALLASAAEAPKLEVQPLQQVSIGREANAGAG